jgi:hypothetical protein
MEASIIGLEATILLLLQNVKQLLVIIIAPRSLLCSEFFGSRREIFVDFRHLRHYVYDVDKVKRVKTRPKRLQTHENWKEGRK